MSEEMKINGSRPVHALSEQELLEEYRTLTEWWQRTVGATFSQIPAELTSLRALLDCLRFPIIGKAFTVIDGKFPISMDIKRPVEEMLRAVGYSEFARMLEVLHQLAILWGDGEEFREIIDEEYRRNTKNRTIGS